MFFVQEALILSSMKFTDILQYQNIFVDAANLLFLLFCAFLALEKKLSKDCPLEFSLKNVLIWRKFIIFLLFQGLGPSF